MFIKAPFNHLMVLIGESFSCGKCTLLARLLVCVRVCVCGGGGSRVQVWTCCRSPPPTTHSSQVYSVDPSNSTLSTHSSCTQTTSAEAHLEPEFRPAISRVAAMRIRPRAHTPGGHEKLSHSYTYPPVHLYSLLS